MKQITILLAIVITLASCSKGTKKGFIPFLSLTETEGESSGSTDTSSSTLSEASEGLLYISVEPVNNSIPTNIPQQYIAIGVYSGGYTMDITDLVTWSSGDPSIATIVSNTGVVTGVSTGNLQITATLEGVSGTGNLTVTDATLESIEVIRPNSSGNIASGEAPAQLTAIGTMSDGTTIDLTNLADWSSSDTGQATVNNSDNKGNVSGISGGTPTITASFGGKSDSLEVNVTEATLTSISIDTDTTIPTNSNKSYKAIGIFSDGSTQDISELVEWTSSDTNVAPIKTGSSNLNSGVASGNSVGSTTITATYNGKSASSVLKVVDTSLVSSLSIIPSGTTTIGKNTTTQYTAIVTYSDGTTKDVTNSVVWSSSDNNIADISNLSDSKGTASGVASGNVTITATYGGKTANANLSVAEKTITSIAVSDVNITSDSSKKMTAIATYSDGSTQDVSDSVTWSQTSNTGVAEMTVSGSDKGTVSGISSGSANVTASLGGVTSNSATVNVKSLSSIAVTSKTISVGGTAKLKATGTYSDGSTEDITDMVTWTPNTGNGDTSYFVVGNVDGEKGLVVGKSAGTANATATLDGVSGSGTVIVNNNGSETQSVQVSESVSLDTKGGTTTETDPTGDFEGALFIVDNADTKGFVADVSNNTMYDPCDTVTCLMNKVLAAISGERATSTGQTGKLLDTEGNTGYNLINRGIVNGAPLDTEVASLEVRLNPSQEVVSTEGQYAEVSSNDMRNHYLEMLGLSIEGGTISGLPTTGSGDAKSDTFRIEVQASKDGDTELVMLGITTDDNYSTVEIDLTSLINGTNIAPSDYTKTSNTNNFASDGPVKVDFLVSVNNSATMSEEQGAVSSSLDAFYGRLQNLGVDFRMSVVTSDCDKLWSKDTVQMSFTSGQHQTCQPNPIGSKEGISDWGSGTKYFGPTDKADFNETIGLIGIRGWSKESNLLYAEMALRSGGTFTSIRAANGRSNVPISVIIITDDPDQYEDGRGSPVKSGVRDDVASLNEPTLPVPTAPWDINNNGFVNHSDVENGVNVTVHAVSPLNDSGEPAYCSGANGATPEMSSKTNESMVAITKNIVDKTGGMNSSICSSTFPAFMEKIADQAAAGGSSYQLSHVPITNTLEVLVGGVPIEMGMASATDGVTKYIYNSATNKLSFTGVIPSAGTEIVVNYSYYVSPTAMKGNSESSQLMAYLQSPTANKIVVGVFAAAILLSVVIILGLVIRKRRQAN